MTVDTVTTADDIPQPESLAEDRHLGWESIELCDGCGTGVSAIWLVFTSKGALTFCGEHHRRFCRARFREMPEAKLAPKCTTCGGVLEVSSQYPDAGYLHVNDADDTHAPTTQEE